jgi:dihydrofolate reductase
MSAAPLRRPSSMARVISNLTMSIDGFVAYPDDSVGELFDWYANGPVEIDGGNGRVFRLTERSAAVLRGELDRIGAFLVGRRLYDHTRGWEAKPPVDAPMVVVTHDPPDDWPRDGVPITFVSDGIEQAVAAAKALAGDGVVSVAGAATARECLAAGLLDEIMVNLVPVVLGEGVPFFAGTRGAPHLFENPEIVAGDRVTHLRYRVRRDAA